MRNSAAIRLRLLGGFDATAQPDSKPVRITHKKVRAVLALLAMAPRFSVAREALTNLLWGNSPDGLARQNLRQCLHLLRKTLPGDDILVFEGDQVALNPERVEVDVVEFERLCQSRTLADLCRAASLFTGEFLAGCEIEQEPFEDWLRAQRERVQALAGGLLERLANQPLDEKVQAQDALAAADRLHTIDPLREDWHRLAVQLYARHRGRTEALARVRTFEEILKRELDAAPEPEFSRTV